MTYQTRILTLAMAGTLALAAATAASATDAGKNGSPTTGTVYTSEIAFKNHSVHYEALPLNDEEVHSIIDSLSDIVSKKHYQLRQSRDL